MFRTLRNKNTLNTLGAQIIKLPDGDYRQYEIACTSGTLKIVYLQIGCVYRNFSQIDLKNAGYKPTHTVTAIELHAGEKAYIRQMAIRAYNNRQGMVLGDNDVFVQTVYPLYIRVDGAYTFTPTQVPDNKMDFVFDTDNPILQGGAPTQYYPPFASAPMILETTWNGKPCKFYMTADEIEAANYLDLLLLADANTDIHLQSGAKVLNTETYIDDESTYITRLNIDGNTAIQLLNFGRCTPQIQIALNNTPNVNRVELGTTISQQAAQAIADMISASTISGKVYGNCGTYNYLITQAVNDNPNWTREDY